MKRLAILTDSTCDLSDELLHEFGIHYIPLYVNFEDESYKDKKEIDTPTLYKMVEEKNMLPKTAAASPGDFMQIFTQLFEEYEEILYTGISGAMSSTLNNAYQAAVALEKEDKVFVIDSKNLSTGIGLILLKACSLRDKGFGGAEIEQELLKIIPNVKSQFAIETMDFLHKGGRCSALVHFFGKIFKIKPIIEVRDGKMGVGKKPRGKMHVALKGLLDYVKEDIDCIDSDAVFITHSEAPEYERYLRDELQALLPNQKIYSTKAGCVISSHCGKGTIGILYIRKE